MSLTTECESLERTFKSNRWHVCDSESAIAANFVSCTADNPKQILAKFSSVLNAQSEFQVTAVVFVSSTSKELLLTCRQLLQCNFSKVPRQSLSTHTVFDRTCIEHDFHGLF